jgi:hypothetical protein
VGRRLSGRQWREDLVHLAEGLRREHREPFHRVSAAAFDGAVRALRGRIPWLADHEVAVELAKLAALIGDGHTALRLAEVPGFRRYPIEVHRFSDGLFLRRIAAEQAAAAGARLLAIDDVPADEAYDAVRPLVSRDNEMGVWAGAPPLLGVPEVLHAVGVVSDQERASFLVQLRDGSRAPLALRPAAALPEGMVDARDGAAAPVPLWLRRQGGENWFEHLPAARALYVAHNRVGDGEEERLAAFFDRVFRCVDDEGVERLVLDLRLNHGGNNALNRGLVHHLIRSDAVNRWGRLFAIVGRGTFSAAMNLAVDLERQTRVLFVGEPTGARPNHYGENGEIVLPWSGLRATVSTLWWQHSAPYDDRPWIAPEIGARLNSDDYARNRDPALDAALGYELDPAHAVEYPDRLAARLRRDDLRLGERVG